MSNTRLLSGRAIKRTGSELSTDRYDYLDLANAEPDLSLPNTDGSILISTVTGVRSWSNSITINSSGQVVLQSLTVNGPSEFDDLLVKGKLTVIGDIVGGPLRTDDIEIVGNRIQTTQSNSNFEINTVGTGSIELLADTNVTGTLTATDLTVTNNATFQNDVDVNGNLNVDGNIILGGNITIGDQPIDTVNVVADFTSNLVPDTDNTYDLGETLQRWRFLYGNNIDIDGHAELNTLNVNGASNFEGDVTANKVTVNDLTVSELKTDDIKIAGNRIQTTQSNSNFEIDTAGSGTIDLLSPTNIKDQLTVDNNALFKQDVDIDGNLNVDGNIILGGNITIGDQTLDTVNVIADFTSNLIPKTDNTYDIGSYAQSWKNVYANNVTVKDQANLKDLTVTGTTNLNNLSVATTISANKFSSDDIQISGNRIETTQSNSNFEIHTSGVGTVNVNADTIITGTASTPIVKTNQLETLSNNYITINSNSSLRLPTGDITQRPLDGVAGQIRFNSLLNQFEGYNGLDWYSLQGTYGALAFSLNGDDSVPTYITFGGNLQILGKGGTNTYVDNSGNFNIESRIVEVRNSANTVITPNLASIKFTGPGVTVSGVGDNVTVDINVSNLYNLGANIDGGSVESIYLFTQNLDGGVPYANYAQTGQLDAGGVV